MEVFFIIFGRKSQTELFNMDTKTKIISKQNKKNTKKEKLAAALRDNLLRRKNKTNENKV